MRKTIFNIHYIQETYKGECYLTVIYLKNERNLNAHT